MGRKLKGDRPPQGAHLAALRRSAGLSQAELARLVRVPQSNIALWERSPHPPRSDALPALARALGVATDDILAPEASGLPPPLVAGAGRASELQRVFEEVRRLPRSQRDRVVEFVSTLLQQYAKKAS